MKQYTLDNAAIQQAVTDIDPLLEQEKVDKQNALRLRLTLEELLLRIRDADSAAKSFQMSTGRRFGRTSILLRYDGPAFDPTTGGDEEQTWQSQILSNLGLSPAWSCRGGVNTVKLSIPKAGGISVMMGLLIAAATAAVIGIAGNYLPETVRTSVTDYLLTPIFNAFLGLINTLAGFMIFLTVASGVFGIGDTAALNRIGKTAFPRFFATTFLTAAIAVTTAAPLMDLRMAPAVQGESQLGRVLEMFFDILPQNPVRPFLDGNMMQVIALAAFTGVVLLILGERAKRVSAVIEELGGVVRMMMEIVCRLIPLFVFVSLVQQIWSGTVWEILGSWKPFGIFLLVNVIVTAFVLLMTAARTKTSPVLLIRKALPAFLIAFSTSSSMAAFSTSEDDCVKHMGVSRKLFDFAFPIGMVVYMPSVAVEFAVVPIYLAQIYAVEIDASWLVMAGILAAVLSIAEPPTPGSGITCYGILLAQLGIPMEAMLMAVALDIVMDFFNTGLDNLRLQSEVVYQAAALNMLDREKLKTL